MSAPAVPNVLHHQVGQHVEYWAYLRTEVLHRGVVVGWFWTQDDDGASLIGEPYKVYRVALPGGGEVRCVHDDTYPDHDATRAAVVAWRAGPRPVVAIDEDGWPFVVPAVAS